jgi:TIR domain-containing protein
MAEPPTEVRGRIFISYRRDDAAYPAGWLFDRLAERFGGEQIFKDVDSIELGDDFVEVIGQAVGASDVVLVLIGDKWLTVADEDGDRRLDDPLDFVRVEVEAALQRNVRIIPILVEGARMPREDQLPPSLAPIARRQALELSPARFGSDTSRLLRVLEATLAGAEAGSTAVTTPRPPQPQQEEEAVAPPLPRERAPRRTRPISVALALAGATLGLAANALPRDEPLGSLAAYAPETLGVPVLVAVTAVLLQAGRISARLGYGVLLGFGVLTTAGAIGIWRESVEFNLDHGEAALVLFVAGMLYLTAGLLGAVRDLRARDSWSMPFRWGPASLLAVSGAVVGVVAMVVPFGTTWEDLSAYIVDMGSADRTGIMIEPSVGVAAAAVAVYTLGKSGAIGQLSAGLALALGAQTMLFYGSVIGAVIDNYKDAWKPGLGAGGFIGLAAGALLIAAGVLARRRNVSPDMRPATATP